MIHIIVLTLTLALAEPVVPVGVTWRDSMEVGAEQAVAHADSVSRDEFDALDEEVDELEKQVRAWLERLKGEQVMAEIEVEGMKYRVTETLPYHACGRLANFVMVGNEERMVVKESGKWRWWTAQDRLQTKILPTGNKP